MESSIVAQPLSQAERFPPTAGFALLVGLIAALSSYAAGGASLGLFFAPVLLASVLVPPLVLAESTPLKRLLTWLALVLPVAVVWVTASGIPIGPTSRGTLVFATYALAIAGIASILLRLRVAPVLASAITVVLGLAWLTWPVWLSAGMTGRAGESAVAWLAPAHPLLAINGVLRTRFDSWDRYTLAYQQLTTLNQDVMYRLPSSIWPSVLLHGVVGIVGMMTGARNRRAAGSESLIEARPGRGSLQ